MSRDGVHARDLTVPTGVGADEGVGERKPATEWRPFFALLVRVPTSCLPIHTVSALVA